QRSRKIQRQRVVPQILTNEIRSHEQDEDHRESQLVEQEVAIANGPDFYTEFARAGQDRLAEELQHGPDRIDERRLAFEQSPETKQEREQEGGQPGDEKEQANPAGFERVAHAAARDGEPAPGVAGEMARPMLIALIEDRHY